jgi:hypothetical protein
MPRDWPCCRRVAVSARALGRLSGAWARGGKRPCAAGSRFIDSEFVGREAVSARALIRLRPVLRTGFPSLGPFAGAPRTRPPRRRPQTCGALPLPAKPPLARLAEIAQNASRPAPYRPPPPWRAHRRARRHPARPIASSIANWRKAHPALDLSAFGTATPPRGAQTFPPNH